MAQVADEITHTVDIVGQANAADHLDEDEAQRLLPVGGHEIPEAHGEHNGGAPVVPPDVPFRPGRHLQPLPHQPVLPHIQVGHPVEQYREYVGKREIDDQHDEQSPVLLPIESCNVKILDDLHFHKDFREFQEGYETQNLQLSAVGAVHDVGGQHRQIYEIHYEFAFNVLTPDLVQVDQGVALLVPLRHEVEEDLEGEDRKSGHLNSPEDLLHEWVT